MHTAIVMHIRMFILPINVHIRFILTLPTEIFKSTVTVSACFGGKRGYYFFALRLSVISNALSLSLSLSLSLLYSVLKIMSDVVNI
jgi:hypothetical protein